MQIISGEEFAEKETEEVIKILRGLVSKTKARKEMKFDWRSMRDDFHSDLLMILLR